MRRQKTRAKYDDVAACVVRDNASGEIIYHELFESGRMTPERAASQLLGRLEVLRRRFPEPKFEVEHTVFGNLAAFHSVYPDLAPGRRLALV